jgi:4-amino-4-deoxy-L-arabinose transferase-like glycosyltransferase
MVRRQKAWLVLLIVVLLAAFGLRIIALTEIPPGLTHDEANHGREALGILDGVWLFYFPLNYGSEPVYSYTVAGSMLLLGASSFSLRLVNVVFGLLTVSAAYAWATRLFDRRTGLLTAVLMSVSFWPLASSREALRAGLLPFFMAGAVWAFWKIMAVAETRLAEKHQAQRSKSGFVWPVIGFGVCVAITLHIYLAARVAWLLFPLFVIYLLFVHREQFRYVWRPALLGLMMAGVLVTPMFIYLQRYPYALTRLDMLDGPLQALRNGNWAPIMRNAGDALLAFIWPGYGDHFLAYNIPGRPVFDAVTAVFFVTGLFICLWRWKRPSYAFLLLWFVVGIIPSLITGPTANTTRNLAALTAVFILPAVGFGTIVDQWQTRARRPVAQIAWGVAAVWIIFAGGQTANDYFIRWGQSGDVRGAYQRNLVEALAYIEQEAIAAPVVMSTVYPGPAHDPSLNLILSAQSDPEKRWVDARWALLIPEGKDAMAIIPASTPPHPALSQLLQPVETIHLHPDDLDPHFTLYQVNAQPLASWTSDTRVDFNGAVCLIHAQWLATPVDPGETAELLMVWQVQDPARIGPLVPPAFTTDMVMFAHVLDGNGNVLAQRDSLEAPSWDWQPDDIIIQIHPISIPPDSAPGLYDVIVGIYDRASGQRVPVIETNGNPVDDRAYVSPLAVGP